MKIPMVVALAAVLTLACVLALKYEGARGFPSDFRDAVRDELEKAAPRGAQDNLEMPLPEAAQPPEAGVAAERGAQRAYSENDPWHRRLAEALGMSYPCYVETKHIGKFYNPTQKLTFDDGRRSESVVFKRYDNVSNTKYYVSKALLPRVPLTIGADKIFRNGVAMNGKFRAAGFKTPEIIATDLQKRIVVTRFLKGGATLGKDVRSALQGDSGSLQLVGRLGSAFAALHRGNLCLGDPKADNVMLADGEFYFIDLDQAAVNGNKGWDIADFFYYSIAIDRMPGRSEAWSLLARTFLQGYLAGGGDAGVVKKALSLEFLVPFGHSFALGSLGPIQAVRHELKKAAGEDPAPETDEALGLVPAR